MLDTVLGADWNHTSCLQIEKSSQDACYKLERQVDRHILLSEVHAVSIWWSVAIS